MLTRSEVAHYGQDSEYISELEASLECLHGPDAVEYAGPPVEVGTAMLEAAQAEAAKAAKGPYLTHDQERQLGKSVWDDASHKIPRPGVHYTLLTLQMCGHCC
jgi:hypothetical protein